MKNVEFVRAPDKEIYIKWFYIKKLMWFLIVTALTILFGVMIAKSCNRFLDRNRFTRVQKVHMKELSFPSILFCPIAQKVNLHLQIESLDWLVKMAWKLVNLGNFENQFQIENYTYHLTLKKIQVIKILKCNLEKLEYENKKQLKSGFISDINSLSCNCLESSFTNNDSCTQYENQLMDDKKLKYVFESTIQEFESYILTKLSLNITDFFLNNILMQYIESVAYVTYKSKPIEISSIFHKVFTKRGFCIIFNLSSVDTLNEQRKLIYAGGLNQGLQVKFLLNEKALEDRHRFDFFNGIGVSFIANEGNYNDEYWELWEPLSNNWMIVPFNTVTNLALKYKSSYTIPVNSKFKSDESCVFPLKAPEKSFVDYLDLTILLYDNPNPPESKLFRSYNSKKCIFECYMKETIKQFNCVPIYAKQYGLYEDIRACSILIESLIEDHLAALASMETLCTHCKPSCKNGEFQVEMVNYRHSNDELKSFYNESSQEFNYFSRVSSMNIYYKDMIIDLQNEEFEFTFLDLITSIGGYIGLFLGGSIISILEIIGFSVSLFTPIRVHSLE